MLEFILIQMLQSRPEIINTTLSLPGILIFPEIAWLKQILNYWFCIRNMLKFVAPLNKKRYNSLCYVSFLNPWLPN